MEQFFKISDFAKQIGKHTNTVDNWFKLLEEKGLHYINRIDNEKVYDEQDLRIAQHINEKRNNKWALEAICNELPDLFELRPFPPDMEPTNALQTFDMESIRQRFSDELRTVVEEMAAAQAAQALQLAERMQLQHKQQYEDLLRQLPQPRDPQAERQDRVTEMLTRRKVERELEHEAVHMWATKPDSERMKRKGLFKKEEDRDKRDLFVKDYIDKQFENRLLSQFGLK